MARADAAVSDQRESAVREAVVRASRPEGTARKTSENAGASIFRA